MKKSIKVSTVIFNIIKYLSLIIASLVAIIPVVVCVLTAFKTNEEYASSSVLAAPKSWLYFENFKIVMKRQICFVDF